MARERASWKRDGGIGGREARGQVEEEDGGEEEVEETASHHWVACGGERDRKSDHNDNNFHDPDFLWLASFVCVTSVRVDSSLWVLSRVVQQSDRQWDMSLSFSLTGGSRIWTSLRPAQSSSHQPSKSLSTDRVSLCSS